ncbi:MULTISPECIES: metallopeptidase family protein [Aestuariimicrobium]|uniref:metallopeptidase family protein n=1 Tax=Aestuariimicrobium TaxID=396388 RepID=UPI0003B4C880|nr:MULTISPECIES: metallopeptidase family protein [Aestuariimicrobium]
MPTTVSAEEFDAAVERALEEVPSALLDLLDNCVVLVEDEPDADDPDLLGYYDGTPLTERDTQYSGVLPDRIVIFRGPLQRMCESTEELVDEITVTVVHEIAHFFGIDDRRLHDLGWD